MITNNCTRLFKHAHCLAKIFVTFVYEDVPPSEIGIKRCKQVALINKSSSIVSRKDNYFTAFAVLLVIDVANNSCIQSTAC